MTDGRTASGQGHRDGVVVLRRRAQHRIGNHAAGGDAATTVTRSGKFNVASSVLRLPTDLILGMILAGQVLADHAIGQGDIEILGASGQSFAHDPCPAVTSAGHPVFSADRDWEGGVGSAAGVLGQKARRRLRSAAAPTAAAGYQGEQEYS